MSPYAEVWHFTRERLAQAYQDLSEEQMRWRPHDGAPTIAEMLLHVAGVEHWLGSRLQGVESAGTPFEAKLECAARAGFVNDEPFPFPPEEATKGHVDRALAHALERARPAMEDPTEETKSRPVETPIGPVVPGVGGLWRIAQHAAYHTGQVWTYRTDPRFPS